MRVALDATKLTGPEFAFYYVEDFRMVAFDFVDSFRDVVGNDVDVGHTFLKFDTVMDSLWARNNAAIEVESAGDRKLEAF